MEFPEGINIEDFPKLKEINLDDLKPKIHNTSEKWDRISNYIKYLDKNYLEWEIYELDLDIVWPFRKEKVEIDGTEIKIIDSHYIILNSKNLVKLRINKFKLRNNLQFT